MSEPDFNPRLELWARIEETSGVFTHAVYDIDTDRVHWYESETEARAHLRIGYPIPPVTTAGRRR